MGFAPRDLKSKGSKCSEISIALDIKDRFFDREGFSCFKTSVGRVGQVL
jgi:hypothetical protein